ncbi:MAG TPA: hypothetical protein VLA27_01730 [Paracoccaceae bacterium]|nr:hypothetical protein [Paracoccaceae bacterium]
MKPLDLFAVALLVAGASGGWHLASRRLAADPRLEGNAKSD